MSRSVLKQHFPIQVMLHIIFDEDWPTGFHYENTPMQIYRKFHLLKLEIFRQKTLIFFIFLLKTQIVGTRRGGSNEYPQSMFLSRNKKNNVYPCKPQFYYIKVAFKGVNII